MSHDDLDALLNGTDGNSDPGQGGKLRQLLEQALAKNKAMEEQLAQVTANERNRSLESLLAKHGVPTLARDLFPADAEPTDEAVTALVEKYGQLWGATAAPATTDPAQQAATAVMQTLSAQAAQPTAGPRSEEEYRAKFAEAKTRDEFLRQLSEYEGVAFNDMG